MKKSLIILVLAFFALSLSAQNIPDLVAGLKVGGNNGFGTELTAQKALTELTRVELNLGFRGGYDYYGGALWGTYQWVNMLTKNIQWHYGAGAGIGTWGIKEKTYIGEGDGGGFVALAGVIGAEYLMEEYPLQVSVDTMPKLGLFNYWGGNAVGLDLSLSVRYLF